MYRQCQSKKSSGKIETQETDKNVKRIQQVCFTFHIFGRAQDTQDTPPVSSKPDGQLVFHRNRNASKTFAFRKKDVNLCRLYTPLNSFKNLELLRYTKIHNDTWNGRIKLSNREAEGKATSVMGHKNVM